MRWWGRRDRATCEPGAGVSSWHLWWLGLPPEGVAEVAVTIQVTQLPVVDRLYFWALQATFADAAGTSHGGAHLGPQWNDRHPDRRALNWGGYASPPSSAVLRGTGSPLPSAPDDPNTRDYPWRAGDPYRLRILRGAQGWRGEVTDLARGDTVVVRTLDAGGDRLTSPVVWSEVFCRCDHPPAEVRWSDFAAIGLDGAPLRPRGLRVNLPGPGSGACQNVDVAAEPPGAVRQRSGTPPTMGSGAVITLG